MSLGWPNTYSYTKSLGEQLVHVPVELNLEKFDRMFVDLMTRPTPGLSHMGH